MRPCISIRGSVRPSVHPSVRQSDRHANVSIWNWNRADYGRKWSEMTRKTVWMLQTRQKVFRMRMVPKCPTLSQNLPKRPTVVVKVVVIGLSTKKRHAAGKEWHRFHEYNLTRKIPKIMSSLVFHSRPVHNTSAIRSVFWLQLFRKSAFTSLSAFALRQKSRFVLLENLHFSSMRIRSMRIGPLKKVILKLTKVMHK